MKEKHYYLIAICLQIWFFIGHLSLYAYDLYFKNPEPELISLDQDFGVHDRGLDLKTIELSALPVSPETSLYILAVDSTGTIIEIKISE